MAVVNDILAQKGSRVVVTVAKGETVLRAAQVMNEHRIGALVVLEGDQIAGMFTERDVLRRVVGEERAPAATRVEEVMTAEVACCTPQTPVEEARAAMKNQRIRHLPVVGDNGSLQGVISIGDVNAHETADHQQTIFLMREYLYGRV